MAKDRKRSKHLVAQRAASTRRRNGAEDPLVVEAVQILSDLAAVPDNHRFSYYMVEPRWLAEEEDLDVPVDGRLHAHAPVLGNLLHLPETHRRNTIREASLGFTSPFIAVLRNPETANDPVGHAVIVQGANLESEMLLGPLHIIQTVRHLRQIHFAALLGMATADGEWTPASQPEMQEIVSRFQMRVEAEAVLAAAPHIPRSDE